MAVFGKKSLNPGDPILTGGPGPDVFDAPAGNAGIDAFGGIDTVNFNFRLVDATITYAGPTVIIDTATSHTELTGIQRYVFTDGTVDENDGNALVDDLYYYSRNHDLWTANGDAEAHFAEFGWQEGRNPSAFFSTKLYLVANSDVRAAGVDPLQHFHEFGWKEGRLPSISFDTFQYLQNNPDVAAAGIDPLEHFLALGRDEGRASYISNFSVVGSSGFDEAYYLLHNPDVEAAGVDPLEHFRTFGWKEGRDPNAWFDTRGYLATYTDVAAAGVNPFEHYLQFGWKEGRNPLPAFDTEAYLLANPDVAAAGVNPLVHYLQFGVHEGRSALSEDFNTILNPVVLEGSATGTVLFPGLSWGNWISPLLSFTLTGDSSGGGFAVNSATGALTIANGSLIDFETSGGAHTLTVLAQLGSLSKALTFTVGVTDAAPTISSNAPTGSILEGAANGTTVGITVTGSDPNGPAPIFTLANDAGGRFTIDASGVISVANGAAIDFETAPGHTYSLTARATVGALSADLLLTINVGNVNEAPAGADHTAEVAENSVHTFTAADFGFTDPNDNPTPNNLAGVVITAITGAGALTNNGIAVANGDFVSAADIAAGNLKFTPAANANGDNYASFAFQVRDDGGTANGGENTDQSANTMTIDVNAVNDTPSFTVGADQTVNEDAGPQTVNGFATGISAGPADEAGQAVDFIVSNNDNALFAVQPTIDASGNLTYTLAADANGSATVTVQIHDNGGGADTSAPQTFVITVNAVNDAPVNAVPGAQSVNEDTDLVLSGANALSISDVDIGAGNATVTLSVGSGVLTLSDTAGLIFSVGDGTSDSTMAFSGTVGAINAALNGLVYRGNLDASGLDTLTLATDDQGNTGIDPGLSGTATSEADTDTVAITVNAVNDAPVNAVPGAQSVNEDTDLVLSGANALSISDVDIGAGNATATLSVGSGVLTLSGTAGLVFSVGDGTADSTMTFSGTVGAINAALDGLVYRGNLDANGIDTLTLTTDDQGNTGIDPALSGTATSEADTDAVAITVNAVNDAPVNGVPGAQSVNEDTDLVLSGANALSISDLDIGGGDATVTLSVLSGALTLSTTAGLTFSVGDGTSDSTMTFSGTVGAINAAMNGLVYRGNLDDSGIDTLTLTTDDQGNTGIDPGLSGTATSEADTDTVAITVNAVNDAPVNAVPGAQSVNEDTDLVLSGANALSISDVDIGAGNATATLSVGSGVLTLSGTAGLVFSVGDGTSDATMTFSGTVGAINAALNGLVYRGNLDASGLDTLTLTTDDQGNTGIDPGLSGTPTSEADTDTVAITVNPVNDEPALVAAGNNPSYTPGADLFTVTSLTAVESGQLIDTMVLSVTNVSGTDESLFIDGTSVPLVNGTTPTATAGVSVTVSLSGTTAQVTLTSSPAGLTGAALGTIIENLTYTKTAPALNEPARVVTIVSLHDDGGTLNGGDDTANPGLTSTVSFNQPPVITSNGGGAAAAVSMDENTTVTGVNVDANDPDNGPVTPLVYSIAPVGDGALFTIDSGTGVLTFTSAPNFENPTDSDTNNTYIVTVRASDGAAFDDQIVTITVNDVAEAPVIGSNGGGPTASITANENQTAVTDVDATDPDLPAQTLIYSLVGGTDQAKFNIDSGTGVLTFISAPNFESPTDSDTNNSYVVTVRASDGTLFDDQTITVTVANVNEQPTLAATGATIPYTEDTPSEDHAVTLFTGIAVSAVEPGQNLDQLVFTVSNVLDLGELLSIDGSTVPLVAGNSTTATNGMSVNVAVTGNTATVTVEKSGGISAALMQTLIAGLAYSNTDESPIFGARVVTLVSLRDVGSNTPPNDNIFESIGIFSTVNVAPVNDAPVVTAPGVVNTFIEGAGLATGTPVFVDTAFTVADTDNDNMASATVSITAGLQTGDVLSFTPQFGITDTNAAPEILALSGSATKAQWQTVLRSITFATSTQDPTTSRTISIQVSDGTSNSNTATKNVTITPVNDEPTLTATANGGGAVTFTETSIPGDPGSGPVDLFSSPDALTVEAGQAITQLVISVTNVADTTEYLMIGGTAVNLVNGNSEPVTGGTASVAIVGGTATVTITPTTTFTEAQAEALVDSLAYNSDDDTPTATTHTISVTSLTDNGANGGPNGDDNTGSPTVSTVVTVVPTNDAPVAADFTFNGTNAAIGNTALVVNDTTDGQPDPTGPQKTITGDLLAGATDVDTPLGSLTITAGTINNVSGTLIIEADGDFTYLPAAGFTGDAVFNYTVNDNDALGSKSDTGQITINVATPKIWYVDANAAAGGDGTSDNPFNSLAALNGVTGDGTTNDDVDGTGDIIFMYGGTYTGGIVLEDGQQLITKEHGLTVNGTTLEAANAGSVTTINGTVTLAGGVTANNIQGVDFGNVAGFALAGTNVGNATVNTVTSGQINNTSGGAISINGSGTGMNLQFTSVSSTGGTNAISFNEARGTFNAGSGTLSNASSNTVNITAADASNNDINFTYGGNLSDDGNLLVNITGQTGGTKTFGGTLTDGGLVGGGISVGSSTGGTVNFNGQTTLNTTTATAVNLTSNAGATINFNAAGNGLDITTTTGIGFNATGGGTVTVLDPAGAASNSISSGTGTALNVSGTNIGSGGLTFETISSTGAANGIVLNNTGTAAGNGGLTVTGTGVTDGSGGTIANSTGTGISLTSTKAVNLSNINISGSADDGINGSSVNGFTLTNVNVTNNGNAVGDEGIQLTQLSGSGGIADSVISGSGENQVTITNDTANLTAFNVTNTTISTTNFTTGDDGFRVLNTGSASMNVSITGSTFTDNKGDHFQAASDADASGTMNITFNNNTLSTTAIHDDGLGTDDVIGGGITINTSGTLDIVFQVNNNNLQQAFDDGININLDPGSQAGASMTGTISGNTIGTSGTKDSGSESSNTITIAAKGHGTVDIDVLNNQIFEWTNAFGIFLQNSEGNATLIAKVTGNTLHTTFPQPLPINGIQLSAGATATDNGYTELVLTGNDVTGEGNPAAGDADIRLRQRFGTTVELPGYAGANNDTAAVNAFVSANNGGATVSSVVNVPGGGGFIGGTATPLLAAPGGVDSASGALGDHDLTLPELAGVVQAAISRWASIGLTETHLAALDNLEFGISDLGGSYLGKQLPGLILIDEDAAGYGWFVDSTPFDDAEFGQALSATQLRTDPTGAPAGQMDLLTAVMHEIGHALGLDHTDDAAGGDVMSGQLVAGERRLPGAADVVAAEPGTSQPSVALPAQAFVGQNIVGGFDAEYYLAHNPDVAAAGVDPHAHYEAFGWHEARDPNAFFDTAGYLAHYADVAAAGVDPLQHYAEFGWQEGRDPSAGFDTQAYLAANPDVAAAHVNPLEHFLQFGIHEARAAVNDGMWR